MLDFNLNWDNNFAIQYMDAQREEVDATGP
jgi:hypothetical protein